MPKSTSFASRSVTPANPWVKGLYAGVHTPMSGRPVRFTEADVSAHVQAVERQLSGGYMPPIVLGHPQTDDPRVGSVVDVKLEDGAAWYKVDKLTPEFHASCQKGSYLFGSPKISSKDGTLRHLGALGAWEPAMLQQDPWDFGAPAGDAAEEDLVFGIASNWGEVTASWLQRLAWRMNSLGRILRGQREALIEEKGLEAADKALPSWEIENLETLKVPDTIDPPAPSTAGGLALAMGAPTEVAPASTELDSLRAQLADAERRLAERGAQDVADAFGAALGKAEGEGRLNQALRAILESLHKELLGAADAGYAFGAADPIPSSLVRLVESLPPIVALGTLELGAPRDNHSDTTNPMIQDAANRAAAAKEFR